MYIKQIEQLVVLQGVDNEIIGLEETLHHAPQKLKDLEDKLEEVQSRRDLLKEKVDALKKQKSKLEKDMEEDDHRIKKSKNKLMMVENTKEYHAMLREMDNLEKMNRMREEERTTLVEELTNQEQELAEAQQESSSIEEEIKSKRSALDDQVGEAQKRLDTLAKKRKQAGKMVPAPIMGRYDFIRSRISNPVIVSVSEGVCNGCHISIPPQSYIELQKGQQILSCPNCQRLIYWSEHFSENGEGKE
ncbi:MAG: zinc ribbon domain-containing protein [Desulfovibrionales bacterium]